MTERFTLYWTSLDRYEHCPQQFLWHRGWGNIDVGGGPGGKKPKPYKPSEHHALMGTVIQAVLERMYNDELWKHPKVLIPELRRLISREFMLELGKRHIDWREAPPKDEMLQDITDAVMNFLRTFKHNRLVGPYAKSEVHYLAYANKYTPVGGHIDFLFRRTDTGVTIIDGKNSGRYKDSKTGKRTVTHTDPDQLRFYALLFFLAHNQMPDRLGFVYFRYPYGYVPPQEEWATDADGKPIQPEPETGVTWVPFTKADLAGLRERAIVARQGMDKEEFPANPVPSYCKHCDYETVCPQRQAQKEKNRRKPKTQDDMFDGVEGFHEFDIDSVG